MKKLVMSALALLAISFQPSALRATTIDFSVSAAAINDNVGFGPYRQAGWTFSLEGRTKIDQADPQANPFVAGVAGTVYLGDLGNLGVDQASYFCLGVQSDEPKSKDGQNVGFGGSKGISGEGKHQDEAIIINFDQPQPVSGIKLGLCGIDSGDAASLTLIFANGNRQTFASVQDYITSDAGGFATLDLSALTAPVGSAVDRLALRCLTGHSGVASLTTDLITGVGDLSETLPVSFELGANYPNPFNPSTRIPYSLHVKGHVRIDVYNLLGEHVRTLIDRTQSSGAHEVEWDGISVNGVTAPSGMYFYRIRTKSFSSARKMLLLK